MLNTAELQSGRRPTTPRGFIASYLRRAASPDDPALPLRKQVLAYLRVHGETFTAAPRPAGAVQGRPGTCCVSSRQWVSEHAGSHYVEGLAVAGHRAFLHAWAATPGRQVVDFTLDTPQTAGYLGVPFDADSAEQMAARLGLFANPLMYLALMERRVIVGAPPRRLTVYRGGLRSERAGMVWHRDVEQARWVAAQLVAGDEGGRAFVYRATVTPGALLFYAAGASEVLVDPDRVQGIEREATVTEADAALASVRFALSQLRRAKL